MKHLFYTALCILLVGCSLDEKPVDQIPEEEAFTSKQSLYQNTVATLYNYIGGNADGQGLQGTCRGVYDLQTFGSDEAILPTRGTDWYDGGMWQEMYKHTWGAGHELVGNSWKYLYKVVTLCNNSLEKLKEHEDLAGVDYDDWRAEVRTIRAIYYWYLIDLYGNVPLILSTKTSMNEVQSADRAKVFYFIVEELNDCLDYLPYIFSARPGYYYGHVTYPVALFVLAKLMLNSPVYTGVTDPECYRKCIKYCSAIEEMGYELQDHYYENFSSNNEISKENIFIIHMDKDLYTNQQQNIFRSLHPRHAAALGFSGENGSSATKRTLEIFGYGGEPDDVDVRFHYNYYSGDVVGLDSWPIKDRSGNYFSYVPEAIELDLSNSPYLETAGARMHKYDVDINCTKDGKLMDNDIVLFRFADVLLMRAEAKVRLGEDGSDDFDRVRERVWENKRPCTLENILNERLLELCWEGWRRQDLIRFGQYRSLYEGPDAIDESDGHTTVYPIPDAVVTLNPNIKQNPGY